MPLLSFVKKINEHDDVYTFFFKKPKRMKHKAGQHGLFSIPGLYRPHPFSLSSAPSEEYISFTTRIREGSRFKQRLTKLNKGDSIHFLGPIMNFTFKEDESDYVFLAQGIGSTPFRSMVAQAHLESLPIHTTLIYVSSQDHTFKPFFEKYTNEAHFPKNSHDFRELVGKQDVSKLFYISGTPAFIRSTKKLLRDKGVNSSHIKTDSFLGY